MPKEWILALLGGCLIGIAASVLLIINGRISGISGILFGALNPSGPERGWRFYFLGGLLVGGYLSMRLSQNFFANASLLSMPLVALAGLLVGFGTKMANGCTSGHGVCGISRLSLRSIVATMTFMLTGVATVYIVRLFATGVNLP